MSRMMKIIWMRNLVSFRSISASFICFVEGLLERMKRLLSSSALRRSALAFGTVGAVGFSAVAFASDDALHAPEFPWPNNKPWQSFDHASLRRGFYVYQQVCAACHSLEFVAYRNLVGTIMTEEEAKSIAADVDVTDGPNANGEMFDRPGRLTDPLPRPFANDEMARSANNNALPPDLSVMVKARHSGPDYIFALLTGYRNPPEGVTVNEPLYYNPYFPGGAIAMKPPLSDNMLEYEDGTPATAAQMAKDVTHFLSWTAEPEHDERKKFGLKNFVVVSLMALATLYWKRQRWSVVKSRKIKFF